MKRVLVVSNGIGVESAFPNREDIEFDFVSTGRAFDPDLQAYDVFVAPNGTDHVALYSIRHKILDFLNSGKSVLCFCGWFLDWVPANRWVHDNSKLTRDVRHFVANDSNGFLKDVDLTQFDHDQHGISGWWSCGYIEPATEECVVLKDTWGRALVVADEVSTPGFLFLTASGPLGDYGGRGRGEHPISCLYDNLMQFIAKRPAKNVDNGFQLMQRSVS